MLDRRRAVTVILLFFLGIVCFLLIVNFNLFKWHNVLRTEVREISIEHLYYMKIIGIEKLMTDDSYFLWMKNDASDILYLKRGEENLPFSLNINKFTVNPTSVEEWEKAMNEIPVLTCKTGGYVAREGKIVNLYSEDEIIPEGKNILYFSLSPSEKLFYIYSFSGFYRESKGIGFLVTSLSWKIGMNFFEILNLETGKREIFHKKICFSIGYCPQLLFWLEKERLIIFCNRYHKSLMVLKY